jgi:hypothetical protein
MLDWNDSVTLVTYGRSERPDRSKPSRHRRMDEAKEKVGRYQ